MKPMRPKAASAWISPLARALLKAREGDTVRVQSPSGLREIEILEIRYE
jgi:transcription elongation factor GreB